MINIVCSPGVWTRYRDIARNAPAVTIRGILENSRGVININADKIELLELTVVAHPSRDFR